MIELPHEFLNALFAVLVIFASANRSRQRLGAKRAFSRQSVRDYCYWPVSNASTPMGWVQPQTGAAVEKRRPA